MKFKRLNFHQFQTCLLWQTTVGHQECNGLETADSAKGSCRLYDNVPMSQNVMAIIMVRTNKTTTSRIQTNQAR